MTLAGGVGWARGGSYIYPIMEIKVMKNIIIAQKNKDLKLMGYHGSEELDSKGTYRVIYKCAAGFMASSDVEADSQIAVFRRFQIKHVHSIAYISKSGYPITVYARSGKKVWIAETLLAQLTVGDINQDLSNTALYNQYQYQTVNAKTWADKAYVMNEVEEMVA